METGNNVAIISGKIASGFVFNHEIFGESFFMMDVEVARLSGTYDIVPVMVSERLINVEEDYQGAYVSISGQFRSYNRHDENGNHVILSLFAREINFEDELEESSHINQIHLNGYICKTPVYRKTPRGRKVADVLLAVNRPYKKSDYIPCVCWGRNARWVSGLEVGDGIKVCGRIQSRKYIKKISDTEREVRTAYEISVSKLWEVDDEQTEN